jgi:P3 major capsid protein
LSPLPQIKEIEAMDLRSHRRAHLSSFAGIVMPRQLSMPDNADFRDPILGNRAERRKWRGGGAGGAPGQATYTQQSNDAAQAAVLAIAQPMLQQVFQTTIAGNNVAQGQVLNIPLNQVGLNTKLTIEVTFTISQAAAEVLNRTQFGASNFFSNIQLTDLSNYQRINTAGWHSYLLASLRRQQIYGASYLTDTPSNVGSNWVVMDAPAAVTGAVVCRVFFELPLAYHEYDLRGSIYAQVTSATWRLQLTINPNLIVASTVTDPTLAMYQSSTAGNVGIISAVQIQIFQHYLDQLPMNGNTAVVPLMSLAWNYLIQNTIGPPVVQGQDVPIPYSNYRTFLSTIAIYDNAGTLNVGSDVTYWGIQAANLVFLEKYDPFMATLKNRLLMGDDPPKGCYIFDHRRKPIMTNQFGNTQLVLNASQVNAGASILLGYEMLAVQSQAINAGSLSVA